MITWTAVVNGNEIVKIQADSKEEAVKRLLAMGYRQFEIC